MLFMVIERFAESDMLPVYRRLHEAGRGMPEGLRYLDSWRGGLTIPGTCKLTRVSAVPEFGVWRAAGSDRLPDHIPPRRTG